MTLISRLKKKASELTCQLQILHIAYRDPRTPWHAKAFGALVIAYALSPIDLIPDFIPVLGYLDDLILLPLGIAYAIRMIPPEVMDESRRRVQAQKAARLTRSRTGACIVVIIWLSILGVLSILAFGILSD